MRAAVMRDAKIVVDTVPEPEPRTGEILVRTIACGICGSDLHALKHGDLMVEASVEAGAPSVMDLTQDVVMGHEFCAEIEDYGPNTAQRLKRGTRVVHPAILIRGPTEIHGIGYSNDVPGGFAERIAEPDLLHPSDLPVPWRLLSRRAGDTGDVSKVGVIPFDQSQFVLVTQVPGVTRTVQHGHSALAGVEQATS